MCECLYGGTSILESVCVFIIGEEHEGDVVMFVLIFECALTQMRARMEKRLILCYEIYWFRSI